MRSVLRTVIALALGMATANVAAGANGLRAALARL